MQRSLTGIWNKIILHSNAGWTNTRRCSLFRTSASYTMMINLTRIKCNFQSLFREPRKRRNMPLKVHLIKVGITQLSLLEISQTPQRYDEFELQIFTCLKENRLKEYN
jgi:hypothetical protein